MRNPKKYHLTFTLWLHILPKMFDIRNLFNIYFSGYRKLTRSSYYQLQPWMLEQVHRFSFIWYCQNMSICESLWVLNFWKLFLVWRKRKVFNRKKIWRMVFSRIFRLHIQFYMYLHWIGCTLIMYINLNMFLHQLNRFGIINNS